MREGIHSVVVNVGGDIAVRGTLTEPVDIANPRDDAEIAAPLSRILLHNMAIATCGDLPPGVRHRRQALFTHRRSTHRNAGREHYQRHCRRASSRRCGSDGDRIFHPRAGRKLKARGIHARRSLPACSGNGERIASRGWAGLESPKSQRVQLAAAVRPMASRLGFAPAVAAGAPWDPSMELSINFELAPIGGATKRPFVAAWIEDADHFQVRTLAVWFHEDRWVTGNEGLVPL